MTPGIRRGANSSLLGDPLLKPHPPPDCATFACRKKHYLFNSSENDDEGFILKANQKPCASFLDAKRIFLHLLQGP